MIGCTWMTVLGKGRRCENMGMEIKEERRKRKESHPSGSLAREISLWALLARGSIYKILAILALMVPVEIFLFCRRMEKYVDWKSELRSGIDNTPRFNRIFADSRIYMVFLAAFCLVAFALVLSHSETYGTRSGYTLRRLRVSQKHLFWVTSAYNFLCFILLFVVQIFAALWMCRLYQERMPAELVPSQLEFLAFYRTGLLHNLLPLADVEKWVKSLLMLLAVSVSVADRSHANKWWQMWALIPLLCLYVWWIAVEGTGFQGADVIWDIWFVVLIAVSVLRGIGIMGKDKSVQEPE